jgi:hypothetical protein
VRCAAWVRKIHCVSLWVRLRGCAVEPAGPPGADASGERRLDRWPGRGSGLPVVQDGVQHAERVAVDALGD